MKMRRKKNEKKEKFYYLVFCAPTRNILLMSFEGLKIKYGKNARKFEKLGDAIEYQRRRRVPPRSVHGVPLDTVCVVYDSNGRWVK